MNDKQQVYCLNRQIDSKIARAAQLKKAGRLVEWVALEREIDSDIDRLVYEQGLPWSITMFGYKQVDGRLEIVPEEAELLRLAADLYLEGYGRYKLEDAFAEAGIKGRHGAAITGHGIIDLLCNEKIVGDMLLQGICCCKKPLWKIPLLRWCAPTMAKSRSIW